MENHTLAQDVWPSKRATSSSNSCEFEEPCKYVHAKTKLGDGTYSTVFECKNKDTGMHYAAKRYKKNLVYGLEEMLQNEFSILRQLSMSHSNILTVVDYFETSEYLYLVTDLASGGDLFDRIVNSKSQKIEESQVVLLIKTLLSTVAFLHAKGIVHRDLKAENLLFPSKKMNPNELLIADFGSARFLKQDEKLHDISSTLSYMAPEVLDKIRGHGFEVDVWAIGVIVYFCLCGYMPFDCETDDETKEAINKADYRFEPSEYWSHISSQAKDFIGNCFKTNPTERPTVEELLVHPFLSPARHETPSVPGMHARTSSMMRISSSATNVSQKLHDFLNQLQLPQNPHRNSHFVREANFSGRTQSSVPGSPMQASRIPSNDNISSLASRLSLLEKSRQQSLAEGTTLQGAVCSTPDMVSCFTTPICSTSVSRDPSMSNMDDYAGKSSTVQVERASSEVPKFFI